jgi:hypothetical protein
MVHFFALVRLDSTVSTRYVIEAEKKILTKVIALFYKESPDEEN